MRFKEFLLLESGGADGDNWFYGNSTYPSDAFDWETEFTNPGNFLFLQARWKAERDIWGRKFHNIKVQETLDKKFTSLESNLIRDVKWKHSNKERPSFKVNNDSKLLLIGQGKTSKVSNVLWKKNDLLDKTEELNKIFGKFEISAPVLPTNFDKTWSPYTGEVRMKYPKKKKYSKNINNF